jgi:hypothetical protein
MKIVALDMMYNFVVKKFLIRNCLELRNIIVSSYILKFEVQKF